MSSLRVIACNSGTQMRVRDSSATRIFFKKKTDEATWGPEYNHQVLASSLISGNGQKPAAIAKGG